MAGYVGEMSWVGPMPGQGPLINHSRPGIAPEWRTVGTGVFPCSLTVCGLWAPEESRIWIRTETHLVSL